MGRKTGVQRCDNRWHAAPEWYTPRWLLERIAAFYSGHYFDPCPASGGTPRDNGLALSWAGERVYCNPPYGRPIEAWIVKAMTEPVREVIMLVPAYTETRWYAPLFAHTQCFIRGRLYFDVMGEEAERPAPHPSVFQHSQEARR